MSQENVEVVRRATEEFSRDGADAVVDTFWVPEIVWDMTPTRIPGFGVYTGYDEVRAFMAEWFSAFEFDGWSMEIEQLFDCGDRVLSIVRQLGHGTSSGAEVGVEFAQIFTMRAGKIARIDNYLDRAEALEAVGLSE
jgi:ketosteroid isomerase-like protein